MGSGAELAPAFLADTATPGFGHWFPQPVLQMGIQSSHHKQLLYLQLLMEMVLLHHSALNTGI